MKYRLASKSIKNLFMLGGVLTVFVCAVYIATASAQNSAVQTFFVEAGYIGVVAVGVLAGLNFVIPVPAATLTPLFLAASLSLPFIVIGLTVGTVIADFIGYALGHLTRNSTKHKYPETYRRFTALAHSHRYYLLPLVTLYAALVPFPNEAILIPLALSGVRFSYLIVPLLCGNLIHQTLLVYGVANVISLL